MSYMQLPPLMRDADKLPVTFAASTVSPVMLAPVTFRLVALIAPEIVAPEHVRYPFAST